MTGGYPCIAGGRLVRTIFDLRRWPAYFTRGMITGGNLFAGAAATPLRFASEPRRGPAVAKAMAGRRRGSMKYAQFPAMSLSPMLPRPSVAKWVDHKQRKSYLL